MQNNFGFLVGVTVITLRQIDMKVLISIPNSFLFASVRQVYLTVHILSEHKEYACMTYTCMKGIYP